MAPMKQKLSLVSVVIVMVVVGLPLWWKTTDIYRSSLPYSDIQKLHNQQVNYTVVIEVEFISLLTNSDSDSKLSHFVNSKDYNRNVDLLDLFVTVQCIIQQRLVNDSVKLKLKEDIINDNDIESSIGHYIIIMADSNDNIVSTDSSVNPSSHRHIVINNNISDEDLSTLLSTLCGSHQIERLLKDTLANKKHVHDKPVVARRVQISPGYQITMTMINPDPTVMMANWTIDQATDDILMPFLRNKEISLLGQYTVSSQVLYYTDVKFKSIYSKKRNSFIVKSSDLPSTISSIEAKLGSHVSQWPSLNFVLYLPKPSECPLYIEGSEGGKGDQGGVYNTFLVPQWGGIIIYNHGNDTTTVIMEQVMETIIKQLKLLLGIEDYKNQIQCPTHCIHKWDIDHLLIVRALESVMTASSSLYSLTTLLDNVKNMVISDHIQQEVLSSLVHIQQFYYYSGNHEWESAYNVANIALTHSETAFFDPSILALLYFPDDQKYAIYIPLFLPISVPVVMAILSLIKKWKKKGI